MPATLESNLRETLDAISAETDRAGRPAGDVALLAVTKSVGPRTAADLVHLGQSDLGENRLPSLLAKRAWFADRGLSATWHYIGQIQRNKARRIVKNSEVLHSVDTLQLIDTLERVAAEEDRRVSVYLEVKLSQESAKHGFAPGDLAEAVRRAGTAPHLDLIGLMTMAPRARGSSDSARPVFDELARLARGLEEDPEFAQRFEEGRVRLSMGMSSDFASAIAAGSDVVRIGTALYRGLVTDNPTPGIAS